MATITHKVSTAATTNVQSYASGSFTPVANDLLVAFVVGTGTLGAGVMTDSQGLGWTRITSTLKASSADTLYMFVANTLAAASAMTVTFDCSGDAATGSVIFVSSVSGMTLTGAAAVRQFLNVPNHALGTPAPAFSASVLTGNPTFGFIANATNPATMTPPTSWTELADTGFATPTAGAEYVGRNSGFTGTTVTWGSSSATVYGAIIAEMNTSTSPTVALNTPLDTASVLTATPTLDFTGTDAESDAITYEIQIDTVNTFDSASPTPAVVQSTSGTEITGTGTYTSSAFGSSTVNGNRIVVSVVDDSANSVGSTQNVTDSKGNTYVRIGVPQESNTTGQTVLSQWEAVNIVGGASHTVTVTYDINSSSNNSFVAQECSGTNTDGLFDKSAVSKGVSTSPSSGATATLSQANELVVVGLATDTLQTATAGTGYSNLAHNGSGTTTPTNATQESKAVSATTAVTGTFTITSTNWAARATTFKALQVPLIQKFSATDTGFTDITNGVHTDPFVSAEQIGYTVQAGNALTNGVTYFWRVRSKDPSGSNAYGAWTAARSFTVNTSITTTQTQLGKSRITATTTKTQLGKARLTITTPKTQPGKGSIVPFGELYSYQNMATLLTDDTNLANPFLAADYINVATDDATYFSEVGGSTYNVALFKYKNPNGNSTDQIALSFNGKSSIATSTSPAILQIYNYNTAAWETVTSDTTTAAGTEFTLAGTISVTPANYYTTGNYVAVRIYQ